MSFSHNRKRQTPLPEDEQASLPPVERDAGGRFRGCGNKKGRPKKAKPVPASSIPDAMALALGKTVTVVINGKSTAISFYEVIVQKMMSDCANGSALDRIRILRELSKLGVLDILAATNAEKAAASAGAAWTQDLEAEYQAWRHEYGDDQDNL